MNNSAALSPLYPGGAWIRLRQEVIETGLCTHCGTCVGLTPQMLAMQRSKNGPLPVLSGNKEPVSDLLYSACPGKGLDYPSLDDFVFSSHPNNWLVGCYRNIYIGYSNDPTVRKNAASAGVITRSLMYLLETGSIDGAVVLRHGWPKPWLSAPVIARTPEEIAASSQSVYVPTPVNTILQQMEEFDGRLAYVGLPDQVASLRFLQSQGHPGAQKVDYVLGPYVGTMLYLEAIVSFLRSNGYHNPEDIQELRYRQGEWPGHLYIRMHDGKVLRANKFYYNYLIPFYITRSTLFSVDFTNELTDISVGDAWHPRFESQGKGYSVVIARSQRAEQLLEEMQHLGVLTLEETEMEQALSMHAHMLDFKKRGSFIRMSWRKAAGQPVPEYGYRPAHIPFTRVLVELVVSSIFLACRTGLVRRFVEWLPLSVIGPLFDRLRFTWKSISKPAKRKGLIETEYMISK